MYSSSRDGYGRQQQPYSSQSTYASQTLGVGGSLLGTVPQEPELGGYRGHGHPSVPTGVAVSASQTSHYGGQYNSSVYASSAQQISPMGIKGALPTGLEGRSNYVPSITDSPKFAAPNEHISSSSRGYGQKVDQIYTDKISEYPSSIERRQYSERHNAYLGRDLPSEAASRYSDSVTFAHEHQSKMYDRLDQTALLRQEQLLKAHALQSGSAEAGARQSDYLSSARATIRHPTQDPIVYGGRVDPELRMLMTNGSSYSAQHATSILGAAPQRSVDDLLYAPQSSSNPGYGVSLPPGRDYGAGKGLHVAPLLDMDYPSGMSSHLRVDDRRDAYARELERRDKDRDYLREREKERERERERERDRERERAREREREREKDRVRERERERERERDRREKERDREKKRDLTPPRVSRDRRGSSLAKDVKSVRRESPRREVIHRPHSPVKEKRREYVCKVFSHNYVDAERDYLSLDKRYPKLYISPECSKVVVCWPNSNLELSLYTPVSFEHDCVEEATRDRSLSKPLDTDISKAGLSTVWNAKVILMSGLSQNALAELSSEREYHDRVPHFCNMLRFALLKKNNSLMAIGGPWDSIDGGDPSVDDSSLIRTAMRYVKDVTNLDLKNCVQWNRFLEIHYHRVGKDGLFSHREVTVFYVPDLSKCLPSLDSWRDVWLSYKKAVSERESQQARKKEAAGVKEEGLNDKKKERPKDGVGNTEVQKKKEPSLSAQSGDGNKMEKDVEKLKGKEKSSSKEQDVVKNEVVKSADAVVEYNEDVKIPEANSSGQKTVGAKTGKKKIIKRIVKKKVAVKKDDTVNAVKKNDEVDKEGADGEKNQDDPSANSPSSRTFVLKRVVKTAVKSDLGKEEPTHAAVGTSKEPEIPDNNTDEVKAEEASAIAGSTKTTVKKKVIKRVTKRKAVQADTINKVVEDEQKKSEKMTIQPEHETAEHNKEAAEKQTMKEVISKDKSSPKKKQEVNSSDQDRKEDKIVGTKESSASVSESGSAKQKDGKNVKPGKTKEKEELNDNKERKDEKNVSRSKADREVNDKKKSEEPPRHPGLFLQTKGSKDSKMQSLSLSLDSLLDYSDTDIGESTFELSLFAEALYELLQYKMGCRLLDFLQKLRIRFVAKRKESKRRREETSEERKEESSSSKRAKKKEVAPEDNQSIKHENNDSQLDESNKIKEEQVNANEQANVVKMEVEEEPAHGKENQDEIDDDEEEEDPEEDEEMPEASPENENSKEASLQIENSAKEAQPEMVKAEGKDAIVNEKNGDTEKKTLESIKKVDKDKAGKVESEPKRSPRATDKELLQAFRFFDRNRTGYIRVENLRLVIHNLGKFLSHRDVKDLVHSALLESSTGRDDRILYEKLVKI